MPLNKKWNQININNSILKWFNQNQSQFKHEAELKIREFCGNQESNYYPTSAINYLAYYNLNKSIVEIEGNLNSAIGSLLLSLKYEIAYYLIVNKLFELDERVDRQPRLTYREAAFCLGACLMLSKNQPALEIGNIILKGLDNGVFFSIKGRSNDAATFILYIFNAWQKISTTINTKTETYSEYSNLINLINLGNSETLELAIIQACDLHTMLSQTSTKRTSYDFSTEAFRILPIEILAFLRVRETLGYSIPAIDHPILNTKPSKYVLAGNFSFIPFPDDLLLDNCLRKIEKYLKISFPF